MATAITIPRDASGTREDGGKDMKSRSRDQQKFEEIKKKIEAAIAGNQALQQLAKNIRFTETREGLRIDLIDQADFAMFGSGTDQLTPRARALVNEVAGAIGAMPNDIVVRGHTDSLPYASGRSMNNWLLSSSRAEATRKVLAENGIPADRFSRIEGVADREPFVAGNSYDPRNRRMSIVLAWTRDGTLKLQNTHDLAVLSPEEKAAIKDRDDPQKNLQRQVRALDLGKTALPRGAVIANPDDVAGKKANKPGH